MYVRYKMEHILRIIGAWIAFFAAMQLFTATCTNATVTQARAYVYKAVANPENTNLHPMGLLDFIQISPDRIKINGSLCGIHPAGQHGFHVHTGGDLGQACNASGVHFNPHKMTHGGPDSSIRHVGDLGNLQVTENGSVYVEFADSVMTLNGVNSVVGRAIVVHLKPDDLGNGNNEESKKTGNSGLRIACGIIGIKKEE